MAQHQVLDALVRPLAPTRVQGPQSTTPVRTTMLRNRVDVEHFAHLPVQRQRCEWLLKVAALANEVDESDRDGEVRGGDQRVGYCVEPDQLRLPEITEPARRKIRCIHRRSPRRAPP